MKEYIGKIFECSHCGKKSAWKHVIVNHEKTCKLNPNNKHVCFDFCKHLIKEVDYPTEDSYNEYKKTHFRCAVTKKDLHSYKVERLPNFFKDVIDSCERMPLECKHYESQDEEVDEFSLMEHTIDFFKNIGD